MVITRYCNVSSRGSTDIIDITPDCQRFVSESGLNSGVITIFNPGSTGGVSTIEYESNLILDLKDSLEIIAPSDKAYNHERTWHDDNGVSHIRATVMGPSLSGPFVEGELTLGTWQQIIFCEFDTRPRKRKLVIQLVGE